MDRQTFYVKASMRGTARGAIVPLEGLGARPSRGPEQPRQGAQNRVG
jgi:hypothetical protein